MEATKSTMVDNDRGFIIDFIAQNPNMFVIITTFTIMGAFVACLCACCSSAPVRHEVRKQSMAVLSYTGFNRFTGEYDSMDRRQDVSNQAFFQPE